MMRTVNDAQVFAATGGVQATDQLPPALVLVHGAGMDASVWQQQTRYVAQRCHQLGLGPVLAVDLPGHGRSGGQALTSITAMADWLADYIGSLLTESGSDKAPAVAGHSMGTFIALELAARHPELVRELVLLGTAEAMPVHPDLLDAATNEPTLAAALMSGWSHAKPSHLGPNPAPGMAQVAAAQALINRSPEQTLSIDLTACATYDGALAAASSLTCPVTVVTGSADKMTPTRAAKPLLTALADGGTLAETVNLDVGHMMMTEAPGEVRRILLAAATS